MFLSEQKTPDVAGLDTGFGLFVVRPTIQFWDHRYRSLHSWLLGVSFHAARRGKFGR
jgi:hypothetical protein